MNRLEEGGRRLESCALLPFFPSSLCAETLTARHEQFPWVPSARLGCAWLLSLW